MSLLYLPCIYWMRICKKYLHNFSKLNLWSSIFILTLINDKILPQFLRLEASVSFIFILHSISLVNPTDSSSRSYPKSNHLFHFHFFSESKNGMLWIAVGKIISLCSSRIHSIPMISHSYRIKSKFLSQAAGPSINLSHISYLLSHISSVL